MIDLALVSTILVIFVMTYLLGRAWRNLRRVLEKYSQPRYDELADSQGASE